ncbi:MAG: hypothetical protein IPM29_21795 [Planctomycetes bacterium]|nr:hypothetical protein [Planctomycetota bacterium]
MRLPRRLLLTLLGTLAGLVALELALQLAALVVGVGAGREAGAAAAGAGVRDGVVLCVGDSFTYGFGAEPSQSYPRRLEARLRAAAGDPAWQVVNGGWSGNHSPRLLEDLPRQLARHRPAIVCVLVGVNDVWRGGGDAGGFELRTVKLLKLAWHWLREGRGPSQEAPPAGEPPGGRGTSPADAPFVGAWHAANGVWLEFAPGGRLESSFGDLTWVLRDGRLVVQWPGRDEAVLSFARDGDALWLEGGPLPGRVRLAPGRPAGEVLDAAQAAAELPVRLAAFERAPADVAAGIAALDAARAAGRPSAMVTVAAALLRAAPAPRWLGEINGVAGRADATAQRAAEDALRDVAARADLDVPLRGAIVATLVSLLRAQGRDSEALGALFDGRRMHGADDVVVHEIQSWPRQYDRAALDAALAGRPAEERTHCEALWRAGRDGADRTYARLTDNLLQIVALCRAHGAEPVLLTYPMRRPRIEAAVRAAAGEAAVRVVDLRAPFDAALRTTPRDELFILDGHPTPRGYDLMAETVAAELVALRGAR